MSLVPAERLRVLLADPVPARRGAVRAALGDAYGLAEAASAEEVLGWLDLGETGITLLDTSLPGAGIPELEARIRELHPQELVVLLVDEPSVGLCRAAMRAGAYDCLGRAQVDASQVQSLGEAAARRREERARVQRAAGANSRQAVRVHEREAAVRLCGPSTLELWRSADADERARWIECWDRAVQSAETPGERRRALDDLLDAIARRPRAADLLSAVHLHAAGSVRWKGREDGLERAREVLVEALQRLADRRGEPEAPATPSPAPRASGALAAVPAATTAPSPSSSAPPDPLRVRSGTASGPASTAAPVRASASAARVSRPGPEPSPRPGPPRMDDLPDLLWHRWCLADGGEEWTLVGEGRPLARVSVVADGCRAWIRDQDNGGRVVAASLPPVPAGLREVERRLGLQPVLTVRSASVAG